MNKWVNPSPRNKAEDEVPPEDGTNCIPAPSFDTIKKQVRKKKVSKKRKKDRIADKIALLTNRLGYEAYK